LPAKLVMVVRSGCRCVGKLGWGGSGVPGRWWAWGSRRCRVSAVCRWWAGLSGTEGSTPMGMVRVVSSVSDTPRSVSPVSRLVMICGGGAAVGQSVLGSGVEGAVGGGRPGE